MTDENIDSQLESTHI